MASPSGTGGTAIGAETKERRSEIIVTNKVWFEETGEVREIVRDCRVCRGHGEVYGSGVVSPTGVVHITVYETTLCGKDATGERWWWPL